MLISGVNVLFIRSADLAKNFAKFGYPESAINVIGWCALIAAIFI